MPMARKKDLAPPILTAAIYARYSSSVQNDASIEQQVSECQAYADANGLKITAVFEDRAISGKKDNRPGLQKMLRAADRHEFQVLLAYKSNRISRNMKNALVYEERLSQAGVKVVYCKEEFGDNATGRFMLRMMMNMNQFYSENMAEDIRRGMRDSASQGKVVGIIPYGYRKGEDGKFAIEDHDAAVVREIFRRFNADESVADIAKALNSREIVTKQKKPWGKNSFHSILVNERYTGVYIYGDIRIENGMPQIIERGVFELAQKKLNAQKTTRARHRDNEDYILTGKLFCGYCLAPMVGLSGRGRLGNEYFYYSCQTKRIQKTCHKKNVRKEAIEYQVTRAVLDAVLRDETIEWIADKFMILSKQRMGESKLSYYEQRFNDVKKQIANILRAVEMGIISDEFKERMAELQDEKKNLLGLIEIEKITTKPYDRDRIVKYLYDIRDGDAKDKVFQRKVVRQFVRAVYLFDDHLKLSVDFTGENTVFDIPLNIEGEEPSEDGEITDSCLYKDSKGVPLHSYTNPDPRNLLYFTGSGFVITWYFDQNQ